MIKQAVAATITLLALAALNAPAANAQGALNSQGATGMFGNSSRTTNNFRRSNSFLTGKQSRPGVKQAGLGGLAPISGPTGRNGLPVTSLDSFVLNAGGSADQIYGDEGADGIPPYFEYTQGHRINAGITGARDAGITTGHGSYMPDASGGDEFVKGPEWSMSGSNGGNPQYWSRGVYTGADPGTPGTAADDQPNDINMEPNFNFNTNSPNGTTDPTFVPPAARPVNNTPFGVGSAGSYRSNEGPTAPGGKGDGSGGSGF